MIRLSQIAAIAGFALALGAADAQVLTEKNISMQMAMTAFQGAVAECKKSGSNDITVAIVDRAGQVALLARANNASPHNLELARRKAYTARTFRQATSTWMERTALDAVDDKGKAIDLNGQRYLENTIAEKGGMPIIWHGDAIGGVGVTGSKGGGEADEACAKAGVAAIANQLL